MTYIWMVLVNNSRIIGYVRSESETSAFNIAKEKVAKDVPFFLERVYLGSPIPVGEEFFISN